MNIYTGASEDSVFAESILSLVPANSNLKPESDIGLFSLGYRLAALIKVHRAVEETAVTDGINCISVISELSSNIRSLAEEFIAMSPSTYEGLVLKACIGDYASKNGFRNIFSNEINNLNMLENIVNINSIAN